MKMPRLSFIMILMITSGMADFVSANNWGGFFKSLGNTNFFLSSVFSTFHDFVREIGKTMDAAMEEDCVYTCPNGMKPQPNRNHIARGNGCGVPGLQIPKYVPMGQFEKCCNKHDICYGTCNEKQQFCDDKFKECLYKICSSLEKYISDDFLKGCKLVAKTMYTAVTAMGCKYYLDAQDEACVCYKSSRDEF